MHSLVNRQDFVKSSLAQIAKHLNENSDDVRAAVGAAINSTDPPTIESTRAQLASQFAQVQSAAGQEVEHGDVDFVSRVDIVGVYQSVLSSVFSRIPSLQGYGDRNPVWIVTLIEQGAFALESFFKKVYQDVQGNHEPLLQSILKEWKDLKFERAPYPSGTPKSGQLPSNAVVALLADWGGDNPAAQHVASIVRKHSPDIAIHLGDIYYGGTQEECESFLRLWPFQTNSQHPLIGVRAGTSYALNGNHEMYSGGEAYFNTVLKAFGQSQPFFCLESNFWRLIGLDTAYNGGRLKPTGTDDPIATQWNWLVDILKNSGGKKNIFLTHHQPVSGHTAEFNDSKPLRQDIADLLAVDGVPADAIFGWFFGHEHRCALYRDSDTGFNARLIGNGCIPHEVQIEREADTGCTPIDFVNRRQDAPDSNAAVSMFAKLTFSDTSPQLLIEYIDEDNEVWGTEVWDASKGRLGGVRFQETDFDRNYVQP